MSKIPMPEEVQTIQQARKRQPEVAKVSNRQAKYDLIRMSNPNGPQTVAAKEAGYSIKPGSKASKIEKASKLRISAAMDNVGLTTSFLARRIKEGMNATRDVTEVDKDGAEKTVAVPDHRVRMAYLTLACKLRGLLDKKIKIEEESTTRHEFSASLSIEEKKKMLRDLEIPANASQEGTDAYN